MRSCNACKLAYGAPLRQPNRACAVVPTVVGPGGGGLLVLHLTQQCFYWVFVASQVCMCPNVHTGTVIASVWTLTLSPSLSLSPQAGTKATDGRKGRAAAAAGGGGAPGGFAL